MVAHKLERTRRYRIGPRGCDCRAFRFYRTCKHWLGLEALAHVEIERYTWLGWAPELRRVRELLENHLAARG